MSLPYHPSFARSSSSPPAQAASWVGYSFPSSSRLPLFVCKTAQVYLPFDEATSSRHMGLPFRVTSRLRSLTPFTSPPARAVNQSGAVMSLRERFVLGLGQERQHRQPDQEDRTHRNPG